MKKIVIFGATGNTGLCALNHAVEKGLNVRVFVRDSSKVPEELKEKVEIFVGDVTNAEQVSKAIEGTEGVVVVLGTRNSLNPTTVLSEGMKNIIEGMKTHNVETVSACLSSFLFFEPGAIPSMYKNITEEHQRMLDLIKESGLKWISVCPPRIMGAPGSKYTIKHGESSGHTISKYDLGDFLVECLEKSEHYQKICGIANC